MKTECHRSDDACAFGAGELPPPDAARFQAHLAACEACRDAVDAAARVVERLRTLPPAKATRDLAVPVLASLRDERHAVPWRALATVAAGLAASVSLLVFRDHLRSGPPVAVDPPPAPSGISDGVMRALDWFVRTQESDGSWSAERWGGHRNYSAALTALPLLALATDTDGREAYRETARRGSAFLLRHQAADGSFGEGGPYNHCISTLALLRTYERWPGMVPRPALTAAAARLRGGHDPEDAARITGPQRDPSIGLWRREALELAAKLGCSSGPGHADADGDGDAADAVHPLASGMGRSLDFFNVYRTSLALRTEKSEPARKRLADLQREILRQQVAQGSEGGSWTPDAQWGRAGGRIYSTALASLALRNERG